MIHENVEIPLSVPPLVIPPLVPPFVRGAGGITIHLFLTTDN
ncbi:hypothetical protein CWATWH0005_443 [Crocosphaera watsonii WH 0005]|uniref:Uncharacterized protein n=1 Tax=Crocosphaera watsonii WH 0005 TaxID=423472 RepID=T2IPI6_CROWT|nr:hypothetical protein CWATWH0005_443 [Crocosphaera watsonii WH 0005]